MNKKKLLSLGLAIGSLLGITTVSTVLATSCSSTTPNYIDLSNPDRPIITIPKKEAEEMVNAFEEFGQAIDRQMNGTELEELWVKTGFKDKLNQILAKISPKLQATDIWTWHGPENAYDKTQNPWTVTVNITLSFNDFSIKFPPDLSNNIFQVIGYQQKRYLVAKINTSIRI